MALAPLVLTPLKTTVIRLTHEGIPVKSLEVPLVVAMAVPLVSFWDSLTGVTLASAIFIVVTAASVMSSDSINPTLLGFSFDRFLALLIYSFKEEKRYPRIPPLTCSLFFRQSRSGYFTKQDHQDGPQHDYVALIGHRYERAKEATVEFYSRQQSTDNGYPIGLAFEAL